MDYEGMKKHIRFWVWFGLVSFIFGLVGIYYLAFQVYISWHENVHFEVFENMGYEPREICFWGYSFEKGSRAWVRSNTDNTTSLINYYFDGK